MRTNIPEKLLKIAADIGECGSVNLTRLAVLKKWFEKTGRLSAFAVWIATRATSRKGKPGGAAARLFREAKVLLAALTGLAAGEVVAVLLDEHPIVELQAIRRNALALHQWRNRKFEKWPARLPNSQTQNGFDGTGEAKSEVAHHLPVPDAAGQLEHPGDAVIRVPLSGGLNAQLYDLASSHHLSKSAVAGSILEATIEKLQLAKIADELAAATPAQP